MFYHIVLPVFHLALPVSSLCLQASPACLDPLPLPFSPQKPHLYLLSSYQLFTFLLQQSQKYIFTRCATIPQQAGSVATLFHPTIPLDHTFSYNPSFQLLAQVVQSHLRFNSSNTLLVFSVFPACLFSTFNFSLTQTRSYKQTAKQVNCMRCLFCHCPSLHYLSNSALPLHSYYNSHSSCLDGCTGLLKFSLVSSQHICFLYYQSFSFFIYVVSILNYPNTLF